MPHHLRPNSWSSNDRSHSGDVYNTNAFRDTILTYVHYLANGSIAGVVIDEVGVGEYRGTGTIEAENFMRVSGPARKEHDEAGRFFVRFLGAGGEEGGTGDGAAELAFPNVRGLPAGAAAVVLRAANDGGGALGSCRVSVHVASGGAELCAVTLAPGAARWTEARCALRAPLLLRAGGDIDLVVRIAGGGGGACADAALDSFAFAA